LNTVAPTTAAEKTAAEKAKANALNLNFRTTGYTFLLVCIFLGQIALVIFIKCFYLKSKVKSADKQYWDRNIAWK